MTLPHQPGSERLPRWTWAAIGFLGGVLGFVVDIYTEQVRGVIELAWVRVSARWLVLSVVVLASCGLTWFVRDRMWRRRLSRETVTARAFDITVEDFEDVLPTHDAVIGRKLRYLERTTDSDTLVVFLHGLGLDAGDFRRFMLLTPAQTAAITLFGFNVDEAHDDRYRPIGLAPHVALISGAITNLQRRYPGKQLVLVGFSLGADLLLKLGELWTNHPSHAPTIKAVTLLDPNVNSSSMSISRAVAQLDLANPLGELKRIAMQASTPEEFHNICEYLHKVTSKNLEQVQRHARDFVAYWKDEPPGQFTAFLNRLAALGSVVGAVRAVFSFHYEDQFNGLAAAARATGARSKLVATRLDHFDLIGDENLTKELAAVTGRPVH